jgi:isochorismate hydrolase
MKSVYFTQGTIEPVAARMLESLPQYERSARRLVADQSALLVLDMQRFFLEPTSHAYIPSAGAIIPGIQALVAAYSRRSRPVVFTRHLNTEQNAAMMSRWWRDIITERSDLSEVTDALDTGRGTLLVKSQYDAFYGTPLDDVLRQEGVRQLLICGVMTHLCCETTARSAFVRGYEVFFTVDGTATYNQDFHISSLLNLSHGFATPLLVADALNNVEVDDFGRAA